MFFNKLWRLQSYNCKNQFGDFVECTLFGQHERWLLQGQSDKMHHNFLWSWQVREQLRGSYINSITKIDIIYGISRKYGLCLKRHRYLLLFVFTFKGIIKVLGSKKGVEDYDQEVPMLLIINDRFHRARWNFLFFKLVHIGHSWKLLSS